MSKQQAIDLINAKLVDLDEEHVQAVADMIRSIDAASELPRHLSDREQALIEQSKQDFVAGRTLTAVEARKSIDVHLEKLGVPKYRA
jgi:hypothetical protein